MKMAQNFITYLITLCSDFVVSVIHVMHSKDVFVIQKVAVILKLQVRSESA
jgi:hypothetical protein